MDLQGQNCFIIRYYLSFSLTFSWHEYQGVFQRPHDVDDNIVLMANRKCVFLYSCVLESLTCNS